MFSIEGHLDRFFCTQHRRVPLFFLNEGQKVVELFKIQTTGGGKDETAAKTNRNDITVFGMVTWLKREI